MFEEFNFSEKQINKYYSSALSDLNSAKEINIHSIKFRICYDALLKLAITLCAKNRLRVKSRKGHHIELVQKLSDLLNDKEIDRIGNEMRAKRNLDLYGGGAIVTEKEAKEYLNWVEGVFEKVEDYLNKNEKLF